MKRLAFTLLLALPGAAHAQQTVDILDVRDNFIAAGIAAQKCHGGDPQREEAHDRNFTIISRKAMEVMKARSPDVDQEELRRRDLEHIEQLQDAAFNLIRSEGCQSEKVRALLRMHKVHENMRF
jgi:hypothetical protein